MEVTRYSEVTELAKAIAFYLNAGEKTEVWKHVQGDEPYPTQYINGDDKGEKQLAIFIQDYGAQKGRVRIMGNFHIGPNRSFVDVRKYIPFNERSKGASDHTALPEITAAVSKGAEKIAHDIKQRFLPEYLPLLAEAIAKRDAAADHEAKILGHVAELAKVAGTETGRLRNPHHFSTGSGANGYSEIECYDDSATIKLSNVPYAMAKKILAMMAGTKSPL